MCVRVCMFVCVCKKRDFVFHRSVFANGSLLKAKPEKFHIYYDSHAAFDDSIDDLKSFTYSRLCFVAGAAQVKDEPLENATDRPKTSPSDTTANTAVNSTTYAVMRMLSTHPMLQHQPTPQAPQHQPTLSRTAQHLPRSSHSSSSCNSSSELTNSHASTSALNGPKCPHCGKVYSNASNLRQHVRNVHVSVDKSLWHTCPTCGKKLKTKHYLINHQLQAHGIHQRVGCLGLSYGQFNDDNESENA
jgi:uncharacterized C2H2 Zn-finger protein